MTIAGGQQTRCGSSKTRISACLSTSKDEKTIKLIFWCSPVFLKGPQHFAHLFFSYKQLWKRGLMWRHWQDHNDWEKIIHSRKTCSSANVTIQTGFNLGCHGDRPATNYLIHAMISKQLNWKWFSIQCYLISTRALLFGRFPGFTYLSFWQGQHVNEDKYGALVEWCQAPQKQLVSITVHQKKFYLQYIHGSCPASSAEDIIVNNLGHLSQANLQQGALKYWSTVFWEPTYLCDHQIFKNFLTPGFHSLSALTFWCQMTSTVSWSENWTMINLSFRACQLRHVLVQSSTDLYIALIHTPVSTQV